jgi:hypothetical protein
MTGPAPSAAWLDMIPWRASLLDWRWGAAQVTDHVSGPSGRAWHDLRTGSLGRAEQVFEQGPESPADWPAYWGRGLFRAMRGDWSAASDDLAAAADSVDKAELTAGARLLAVVTLAEADDRAAADLLADLQRRTPQCPHLTAMTALQQDDPALLGDALLMLPELAAVISVLPPARDLVHRATDHVRARATRLEASWVRLRNAARMLGVATGEGVPSPAPGRPEFRTLETLVPHIDARRAAIADLRREIDYFPARSQAPINVDHLHAARAAGESAKEEIAQFDHPPVVRPLGIPPLRFR